METQNREQALARRITEQQIEAAVMMTLFPGRWKWRLMMTGVGKRNLYVRTSR